jgi:hypothetical protein
MVLFLGFEQRGDDAMSESTNQRLPSEITALVTGASQGSAPSSLAASPTTARR